MHMASRENWRASVAFLRYKYIFLFTFDVYDTYGNVYTNTYDLFDSIRRVFLYDRLSLFVKTSCTAYKYILFLFLIFSFLIKTS